jgi:hypothetical protein
MSDNLIGGVGAHTTTTGKPGTACRIQVDRLAYLCNVRETECTQWARVLAAVVMVALSRYYRGHSSVPRGDGNVFMT